MGSGRKAALTALEKCRRAGAWSDAVIGSVMDASGLGGRERGFCTALCYGVVQRLYLLDHYIFTYCTMTKLEPKVLDILRISVYQLLFMDRVPDSAAVNEGVKLCRELGYGRAAGLVNAVLRKIAADKSLPPVAGGEEKRLSVIYSCPEPLIKLYREFFDAEETERLLKAQNEPAPLFVQVNTMKTSCRALLERFQAQGIKCREHESLSDCIAAEASGNVESFPGFDEGAFYIQDPAAKISASLMEPKAGTCILDLCAAPGGKSFAAAVLSGGRAKITACDLHENKLSRLEKGADRLGFDNIKTCANDARRVRPEWKESFDSVICDVPCSGLGVIRKKPDIRYKELDGFGQLEAVQRDILAAAAEYVRPGGILVYSTCTVRREENGLAVERFLEECPDFSAEDFRLPGGKSSRGGMYQFWPHIDGTDGFFAAKLRRKSK